MTPTPVDPATHVTPAAADRRPIPDPTWSAGAIDRGETPEPTGSTDSSAAVTVQFWAAAKAATGTNAEQRRPGRVGDILDEVCRDHPRLTGVLQVATVLCDGRAARREDVVPAGATLEVLPPFAGG